MLEHPSSFVLASLRNSPYSPEYDAPLHSLRPRWMAFEHLEWNTEARLALADIDHRKFAGTFGLLLNPLALRFRLFQHTMQ